MIIRIFFENIRSFEKMTETFFWPTLDVLLWGLTTQYLSSDIGFSWSNAILGSLILWTFLYNIQRDISLTVLTEVWERNLYNIFSTPLKPLELILAATITAMVRIAVALLVVIPLAVYLFQLDYQLPIVMLLWIFLVLVIFSIGFGAIATGLVFFFGTRIQSFTWAGLFIIQPLSCVFYPLSSLPDWAQSVALMLPTTYVFEGIRSIMIDNSLPELSFLLTALGLSFGAFLLGILFFHRGYGNARKRGWLIQMD
jgi:ABC-2 type transport system permease protein